MEWIAPVIVVVGVLATWGIVARIESRLARVEGKLNALLRHFHLDPAPGFALSERVMELARDPAKKIEAIKAYREETGAGLAEAKEAVEAFMDGQ